MSKVPYGLEMLRRYAAAQGWRVVPGKTIPYGEQVLITKGKEQVVVNYFPKRGHLVLGGSASPLRSAIEAWMGSPSVATTSSAAPATATKKKPAAPPEGVPPFPHIGMDESGKGDWFGPLVIGAVYADAEMAEKLLEKGVKDSKKVLGPALRQMATEIEALIPAEHRYVRVLLPEEYNRLHAARPNINHLLRDAYVETAQTIWESASTPGTTIICDQFAASQTLLADAFKSNDLPVPFQRHGGEALSVAVAAASVLATATFGRVMEELGIEGGLEAALPRGASDIHNLEKAVRTLAKLHGTAALRQYAKLNFKPVQALLSEIRFTSD